MILWYSCSTSVGETTAEAELMRVASFLKENNVVFQGQIFFFISLLKRNG